MRISTMMIFDNMLSNLTKAIERTQNIQEVISTGKKINLLSDDPAGIVQVVNYQSDLTKLSQYKENITHGNSWLDMSDSILQDIQNLVGEAKNIAIAQSTSTMNSETRAQAAVVAQNLYEQLIGYGNTRLAGRYIFGGSITDRAPFNANGTYNGNGEDILVEIIEGIQAKINLAGSEFLITDLNPDLSTAAATSGSTSSTGLTARNINAVLTNPGGSSEYKATFVLTNGLTQEVTYTTDSTPTREELGAGIADAVNNHYTLNQYIRASYDTTTGNITFEAKEAGTEGNQYTIDAANTTAFEGTVNTSFAGGSSEVTSGFVFVGGTNSSIVFRENAGLDINADIITDSGAVSGEVYTGDQVASFIEQSMESKSQTDPNGNSYTYTVSYNETTNLFTIENDATNGGGLGTLTMRWSALNDIGTALGFGAADVGPIAAGGSDVSNNQVEFNILNGVNDLFSISVDGAASVGIDMNAGPETAYTAAGLVVAMNAALPAGATADFGTTITGQFTITSTSTGTGSTVSLTSGADDFLRTVGLDRDFEVSGTSPTPLADLNGNAGVTAGNLTITDRAGNAAVVAVAANQTIDDVITNINGAGVDVTAALNVDGNGITLTDTCAFPIQNLVVADNATARDLGIVGDKPGNIYGADLNPAVTDATRISVLDGGAGLTLSAIKVFNGLKNEEMYLSRAGSITDILNAINSLNIDANASINSSKTALDVNSTSTGSAAVVCEVDGGTTSSELGIQGATDFLKSMAVLKEALDKNDRYGLLNILDQFDLILNKLTEERSGVGVRSSQLDAMNNRIVNTEVEISDLKSEIEDADMVEYLTKFAMQQTALQAIMSTAAQSMQISLLNFLR